MISVMILMWGDYVLHFTGISEDDDMIQDFRERRSLRLLS